jgi:hypothetical protein
MSVTPIQNALPGEDLIGIQPELLQQVDPGWLHRLSLFSGRALTASALRNEQAYGAGRLATLGQCVTHGVVKGLQLSSTDLSATDPFLQVSPGYGISATGDDVALTRTLRTHLGSLLVIDPLTAAFIDTFPNFSKNPANTTFTGVLLLQPTTAQVPGSAVDTGALPVIVSGNLEASCDQDPEEFAFEDFQIVDGVRLVLVAWPSSTSFPALALPPAAPAQSFRNRLVYTIFNAEMALAPDDRLPWDLIGVPLALVGFDTTWKPVFLDRASVVRAGGLARSRYLLPAQPGQPGTPLLVQPALAQARVTQLSEQIAASPGLTSFIPEFAFLPPCGILPAAAMDFTNQIALWFPPPWTVSVAPTRQEEIETALLTGMTAQPLDVTQNESVNVLVPLPDQLYDPNVLLKEQVDPAFGQAVSDATNELAGVLQHRKAIEQEGNALSVVITGTQTQTLYNLDGGLTPAEISLRDQTPYTPTPDETFATVAAAGGFASTDLQKLQNDAKNPPFTVTVAGNSLPLFNSDDMNDMTLNGLQHFINRIAAKVSNANDVLDLAFLTTQSDIYRFRQYVLGATGATALAVSPIAAQIATGESAASTADNLRSYLLSVLPTTTTPPPTTTSSTLPIGAPAGSGFLAFRTPTSFRLSSTVFAPVLDGGAGNISTAGGRAALAGGIGAVAGPAIQATFRPATPGTVAQPASPGDVLSQSPIVGAQLNLRTLSIAKRLQNPPSQEGLFYATGNRVALLQLLADLDLTIDDIPILVDVPPPLPTSTTAAPTTTPAGGPAPVPMPTIADIKLPLNPTAAQIARKSAVLNAVLTPLIPVAPNADPDEASLFSTGIKVLEQHSSLLRAIEARIQLYNDFLTECRTALSNVQTNLPLAQAKASQLDNALAQARQDVEFTTALQNDEKARVDSVNAKRAFILQNDVQTVVFTRPRSVVTDADVPSRQLVPGNIDNPAPGCANQSPVAIPPELREIVGLLREAPVRWMPSIQDLLNSLERPFLLYSLAVDAQARAAMLVQLPPRPSFAAAEPGVYAPVISRIYSTHRQAFSVVQAQRATFQPTQLINQSWRSQIQILQDFIAAGDFLSSAAVHAEVANATSTLIQKVSNVATCLYARAGQAPPIHRLAWAEFLRGPGLSIQLQSLAVLPTWNTEDYIPRQQMQMLVDWLFQQIDTTIPAAVAFMSDVVRVAILLASDAPVSNVIGGAVSLATPPINVGFVVSLNLPSARVAHGMYVHLYSSGVLAAEGVVTDLDNAGVRAQVTQVYQPNVSFQPNDVAHFTAQPPHAVAVRAFDV